MRRFNIRIFYFILIPLFSLIILSGCGSSAPMSDYHLNSYQIVIPGIQKEYKFLYVTDMHIIIPDNESDKQIFDYSNQRLSVFRYPKDKEESNVIDLNQWVTYANDNLLDGLLLGGDIIDSPAPSNIDYMAKSLKNLQIPYVYTLGNHDWTYPWEYMTDKGKKELLPLLSPYMKNNTSVHSQEYKDFIIVAIDNSNNQINPAALKEYKIILEKKKPIILMLHVPLYTKSVLTKSKSVWKNPVVLGGGIHGGIYPNAASTEFLHLTTAKDSPVIAVLAGHVHFANKDDIIGGKNIPQIIGDAGFKGIGTIIKFTNSSK